MGGGGGGRRTGGMVDPGVLSPTEDPSNHFGSQNGRPLCFFFYAMGDLLQL